METEAIIKTIEEFAERIAGLGEDLGEADGAAIQALDAADPVRRRLLAAQMIVGLTNFATSLLRDHADDLEGVAVVAFASPDERGQYWSNTELKFVSLDGAELRLAGALLHLAGQASGRLIASLSGTTSKLGQPGHGNEP